MKEPNMALGEISDIRPHLVLEISHLCKNVFERVGEDKKLGFWK